jgi:hypothetical protein
MGREHGTDIAYEQKNIICAPLYVTFQVPDLRSPKYIHVFPDYEEMEQRQEQF